MITNTNPETGIRYGCISGRSLDPEIFAYLLDGHDVRTEDVRQELRKEAETLYKECPDQDAYIEADLLSMALDPPEPEIEDVFEGVKYKISWLGGAPIVFILGGTAPIGWAERLCSPCVPNAADLDEPVWAFPNAPYRCYRTPANWLDQDTPQRGREGPCEVHYVNYINLPDTPDLPVIEPSKPKPWSKKVKRGR